MSGPGSFGKKCLFITRGQGEEREQTKTNNRMMCMINSLTHPLFRPSLVYCQGRIERTTTAGVLLDSHSISQQGGNCKRVKGKKKATSVWWMMILGAMDMYASRPLLCRLTACCKFSSEKPNFFSLTPTRAKGVDGGEDKKKLKK